ncbi:putative centrosomal protein [Apostichopus japonicus]|uniref:Centrosomal protein of 162 kDa n=1 Tax=Stichopus japonicus TaxID=307972 RepID=A0A2G8JW44_STIJA|nr:putative centrosomal protein [Apostichopus japonicus]
MSRKPKLSQRDLDDAFESFMKESVSDDSLDSARVNQLFEKAKQGKKKKGDSPWWMQKDESDDDPGSSQEKVTPSSTNKWMKPKKQSTPLLQVAEEEEEGEEKSKKIATKGDVRRDGDEPERKEDSQSDAGTLMKKYSERMNSTKESTYSDPLEDSGPGSYGVQGSYGDQGSLGGPGAETLEEMEDKARFFKQLEDKHGGGDVDYAQLNRVTDTAGTMNTLPTGFMGTADDFSSPAPRRLARQERVSPSATEVEGPSEKKAASKVPSDKADLLANEFLAMGLTVAVDALNSFDINLVSLLETGDSTLNIPQMKRTSKEDTRKRALLGPSNSLDRDFAASGTASEMEALHAAMREAANTPTMTFGSKDFIATDRVQGDDGDRHQDEGDRPYVEDAPASEELSRKERRERTVDDIIKEVMEEKMKKDLDRLRDREMSEEGNANNSGNQSQRNTSRERKEPKGVNLSPVFASPERRTGERESQGARDGEKMSFDSDAERDGVNDDRDESSHRDLSNRKQEESHHDREITGDRDDVDVDNSFSAGRLDEVDEDGARGFDLQPAVVSDQRGFDLAPALPCDDSATGRTVTDDEKSVSSRIPRSRKGFVKDSGNKRKTKYGAIKSSGYGPKKKPKPKGDVWSPADKILQQKKTATSRRTMLTNKADPPPELKFSQEEPILSASLRDIRVQPASRERALVAEVNEWQNQWKDERRLNAKLKAEIAGSHRENTRKIKGLRLEHEAELHKLKQDNFVLLAKLNSQDDADTARKRLQALSADTENVTQEERAILMQKDIMEQETLLQGYQQENERLYKELKKLREANKQTEEKLFLENQRLHSQVGNLREVIDGKDLALRNKGVITGEKAQAEIAAGNTSAVLGASRIAELQTEVVESEVQQSQLKQKTRLLEQTNQELRGHIDQLIRDKKHLEGKVDAWREVKQREFQNLQLQHQKEVEDLQKKLKWYSENQELLDKDTIALREKDATIDRLREELEKRNKQMGTKTTDAQRRARERAADTKRIQDLERQVKEMNGIIRKRHPNSIPALMFAAASVGDQHVAPDSPLKSNTAAFLEEKVQRLESELDRKDEDFKRSLRSMQQQNSNIKIQYEERIKQLAAKKQEDEIASSRPHSTISALERELEGAKERFHKEIETLQRENSKLKRAASQRQREENHGNGDERKRMREKEHKEKIESLERDLEERAREVEMLKSACDKLMQEKIQELCFTSQLYQ